MALLETDPVTIALDDDGDLDITNGRTSLLTGLDAVVQGARTRMQLIRGEWFANLDVGVPWLEREGVPASVAILGQRYNAVRLRTAMRVAILRTPGIVKITRLECSFDTATRTATVIWRALTAFGETPIDTLEM